MKNHLVLLTAVFALSVAAAPALAADPDETALHDYVLTTDKLHHYAAFNEALHAQEHNAAFRAEVARMGDPPDHATLAQQVAHLRRSPMMVNMLHQNGLSEQDAVLLPLVAMTAAMAASMAPKAQGTSTLSAANINFVKTHEAEVKAAMGPGG